MKKPIFVSKPYIPPLEKYKLYLERAFDQSILTNNGPLVQELELKLKELLAVKHLVLVANGTLALQIASKIKNLENKQTITTPYTFAATLTSLEWQNCPYTIGKIDPYNWNLMPDEVEREVSVGNVNAMLPVNIFGMPCDLDKFEAISNKYDVPLIYDSAHSLFSKYKGKSIFDFGDIHCVSLHATKLFHSTEGGILVFKHAEDEIAARKLINFGIAADGSIDEPGINAKMSELHAAMGLTVLDDLKFIIEERQNIIANYKSYLSSDFIYQSASYDNFTQPIYLPIKFPSAESLDRAFNQLAKHNVFARKYFHPSAYQFLSDENRDRLASSLPIVSNILCLPLMNGLTDNEVKYISDIVNRALE